MHEDVLERGDDVKAIKCHGWLILWDGLEEGWLRMRNPLELEYWR